MGTDQKLHFGQLFKILELLGKKWASHCIHVDFGRVQGMSTRKGKVIFLEDLLDEDDAREKIGKMTEEEADTRMETYVKQAHPAFREFLKSALAYDSEKRIQDGEELKRRLSQAAKDYRSKRPWNVIRKWAGRATTIVGSALLGSALTLGWQAYSEPVDTDRHERSKKLETKYNPKLETKSNDRFPREVR